MHQNFGFDYLAKIDFKYVPDMLNRLLKRNKDDQIFDRTYQAVLAGRMKREELIKIVSNIETENITTEEIIDNAEQTIAKFSKGG